MSKRDDATHKALARIIRQHADWCPSKGRMGRIRYLTLALCGESGELANFIKKQWRGDFKTKPALAKWRRAVESEACDITAYVFMLAKTLGIPLLVATLDKLREVERRPIFIKMRAKAKEKRRDSLSRQQGKARKGNRRHHLRRSAR